MLKHLFGKFHFGKELAQGKTSGRILQPLFDFPSFTFFLQENHHTRGKEKTTFGLQKCKSTKF